MIKGKYILKIQNLATEEENFEAECPFEAELASDSFQGIFIMEGEKHIFEVKMPQNSIEMKSRNPEAESNLTFDLRTNIGKHEILIHEKPVNLQHEMKLISYEYNNTHFVIQYMRLFSGNPEAITKIEVLFHCEN